MNEMRKGALSRQAALVVTLAAAGIVWTTGAFHGFELILGVVVLLIGMAALD